jgi:hypothetical protein
LKRAGMKYLWSNRHFVPKISWELSKPMKALRRIIASGRIDIEKPSN